MQLSYAPTRTCASLTTVAAARKNYVKQWQQKSGSSCKRITSSCSRVQSTQCQLLEAIECHASSQTPQLHLQACTMPEAYGLLAKRAMTLAQKQQRVLIGIVGCPGSGKSTTAAAVASLVNAAEQAELPPDQGPATVVPMDGFHYYRHQLDAMPDPAEAYKRRGAAWTFDAPRFVQAILQLRPDGATALLPSFDHAAGDPVEEDIRVESQQRIILVEGNYLLLDEEPWDELQQLFDETWFIDTPEDVAMERVFARQTAPDIGLKPEVSRTRIETNDRPNAKQILGTKHRATVLVPSLPL